jgi:hypothetical protein
MKRTTYALLVGTIFLLAAFCSSQSGSLGDYARAARKENKPAATKSFDNDNIPKNSQLSVVGNSGGESNTADGTTAVPSASGTAAQDASAKKANGDAIKAKVEEQKSKIDLLSRELDVSQREYRLRAASFYADAGDRLRNSAAWDKEDAEYKKKIADQQKGLDEAKKSMSDLQEEQRKAGVK